MSSPLHATIQSIDGDRATVVFEDGQTLRVPTASCAGAPMVGAAVRVTVAVLGSEDAGRQDLARDVLNEILTP